MVNFAILHIIEVPFISLYQDQMYFKAIVCHVFMHPATVDVSSISVLRCSESYNWEPSKPGNCSRKCCGPPREIENGEIKETSSGSDNLFFNDTVVYECNFGLVF